MSCYKSRSYRSSALAGVSLLGLLTGCSGDMMRFEESLGSTLITNSTRTPNQQALLQKGRPAAQNLMAVPRNATSTLRDGVQVVRRAPQGNLSTFQTPVGVATAPVARTVTAAAPTLGPRYEPITNRDLPPVTETMPARSSIRDRIASVKRAAGAVVLKPRTNAASPLRMLDGTTTAAIAPPVVTATVAPAATRSAAMPTSGRGGWSAAGGSRVTLKSGETLYNLSRRYGVPVDAIVASNGLASANAVQAGQTVTIPAYTQGEQARVSAPDSNPDTRVARSSTGYQGQNVGRLTTPTRRLRAPQNAQPVATTPAQTASVTANPGVHIITSGQTLYSVSRKYNIRLQALRDANGLTSDSMKIGQRLVLPGGEAVVPTDVVDRTITASVPTAQPVRTAVPVTKAKAPVVKTASADTGAFRWPLNGQVVTRFGAATPTGANDGIDIATPTNSSIRAARSGTVIYSGSELEDFGNLVLLSHAGGYVTAYAHANSVLVKRGQKVSSGQVIAKSGATGNATRPKLHFEIRKNSKPVNPMTYLPN